MLLLKGEVKNGKEEKLRIKNKNKDDRVKRIKSISKRTESKDVSHEKERIQNRMGKRSYSQ